MLDTNQLIQQVRQCTICQDLPLGPKPILQFNPKAKILIAGQAPGRITHKKGIPFDDPSGNRLRDWMGIDRDTFYDEDLIAIVPMGFCFPGTYSKESRKSGDIPPRSICAETWRDKLLSQLPNLELTLVIGRYALDWHLEMDKKVTITELVKTCDFEQNNLLPLPHPSPRNNRWLKNNPWFSAKLLPLLHQRIARILKTSI